VLTLESAVRRRRPAGDPVVSDPSSKFPPSVADGLLYAALAKTASRLTVFTRLALESVRQLPNPRLRIPGVPRTIARHLQKEYDERLTRWYQGILLSRDSLHTWVPNPRSGPLLARFHLFEARLSGAHPLLKARGRSRRQAAALTTSCTGEACYNWRDGGQSKQSFSSDHFPISSIDDEGSTNFEFDGV
jgi:hypothetical protein